MSAAWQLTCLHPTLRVEALGYRYYLFSGMTRCVIYQSTTS